MKASSIKSRSKGITQLPGNNILPVNGKFEKDYVDKGDQCESSHQISNQQVIQFMQKTAVKRFYIPLAHKSFYLTQREVECLKLLCLGFTTKKVAEQLNISPKTMDIHINNIKEKCNCVSLFQLGELVSQSLRLLTSQSK